MIAVVQMRPLDKELIQAVINQNAIQTATLLESRADPNVMTNSDYSILISTVYRPSMAIVELLIQYGADVNFASKIDGWTALLAAAAEGKIEMVKKLIETGAKVNAAKHNGWSPLFAASPGRHYDVMKLLIDNGADINATVWQEEKSAHVLDYNIQEGHTELVRLLIEKRANVNQTSTNGTPLMIAVDKENMELVDVLLRNNADINYVTDRGDTALCWACYRGNETITKYLLRAKADVHLGANPLQIACREGHFALMPLFSETTLSWPATPITDETLAAVYGQIRKLRPPKARRAAILFLGMQRKRLIPCARDTALIVARHIWRCRYCQSWDDETARALLTNIHQ